MKNFLFILFLFIAVGLSLEAKAELQTLIRFKDVNQLDTFLKKNSTFNNFASSNLFRGLGQGVGQFANSIARSNDTWKGTFIRYLVTNFLQGNEFGAAYYHEKRLVSPVGFYVRGRDDSWKSELLKFFVPYTGHVQLYNGREVNPLTIYNQKLAMAHENGCFTLSRDPNVAVKLLKECLNLRTLESDAESIVRIDTLLPGMFGFIKKFFGIQKDLITELKWEEKKSTFVPTKGLLELSKKSVFPVMAVKRNDFAIIPSKFLFLASAWVKGPESLQIESVRSFLKNPNEIKNENYLVSLIHFGAETEGEKIANSSAIVIRPSKIDPEIVSKIDLLFSYHRYYELKARVVCNESVVLTTDSKLFERFEHACSKSVPSFNNVDSSILSFVEKDKWAMFYAFNMRDYFFRKFNEDFESNESANEVNETKKILNSLPNLYWGGRNETSKVVFEGLVK